MKNRKKYFVIILTLFLIVGVATMFYAKNSSVNNTQIEGDSKLYSPDYPTWEIEIYKPISFVPTMISGHAITLVQELSTIELRKNATNYSNLTDHLSDPRNNILDRQTSIEPVNINGYEAMVGYEGDKKSYFIYIDNVVYFIYTEHKELYDELDQIAQSFRYLGDE